MRYLVLETHPAYAIVLDEAGRFLRTANRGYVPGQTVEDVILLRTETPAAPRRRHPLTALATVAACLCLACLSLFFGYYRPNYTAYGSLRIQINPDVELTLSQTQRVLELESLNQDGEALTAGYDYQGKDAVTVAGELVERAFALGYLEEGGLVALQAESADGDWQSREEQTAAQALETRYGAQITVLTGAMPEPPEEPEEPEPIIAGEDAVVVIPIQPPEEQPEEETPPAAPSQEADSGGSDDDEEDGSDDRKPSGGSGQSSKDDDGDDGGQKPSGGETRPADSGQSSKDDDDSDDDDSDNDDNDDNDRDDRDDDDRDDDDEADSDRDEDNGGDDD